MNTLNTLITRDSLNIEAATIHARADRTNPFAFKTMLNWLNHGLCNPHEVRTDAERIIKNAPHNPAMLCAMVRSRVI